MQYFPRVEWIVVDSLKFPRVKMTKLSTYIKWEMAREDLLIFIPCIDPFPSACKISLEKHLKIKKK